jgi:hypothetical protein
VGRLFRFYTDVRFCGFLRINRLYVLIRGAQDRELHWGCLRLRFNQKNDFSSQETIRPAVGASIIKKRLKNYLLAICHLCPIYSDTRYVYFTRYSIKVVNKLYVFSSEDNDRDLE